MVYTNKKNKMIFPNYLHVRDAFIRASSPRRTMFSNTKITLYTAEQRLDIIKKMIEINRVSLHDDLLQILFFAIEFHDPMVANNWNIIKYLIKEKKVCPGKVIVEEYEEGDKFETFIIPFIIRGNYNAILKYLLRHDHDGDILEQFIQYYVYNLGILNLQLNEHTTKTIRIFAEHFGKHLKWDDNMDKIQFFIQIFQIRSSVDSNNGVIIEEIIELLQGYLERALKQRKQIGSELPLPDELVELVLNYC